MCVDRYKSKMREYPSGESVMFSSVCMFKGGYKAVQKAFRGTRSYLYPVSGYDGAVGIRRYD